MTLIRFLSQLTESGEIDKWNIEYEGFEATNDIQDDKSVPMKVVLLTIENEEEPTSTYLPIPMLEISLEEEKWTEFVEEM